MVVEEVVNVSSGLITEIGQIALWLQALGIIVVLYIIFQVFSIFFAWKRMKEIYKIKDDMKRIEDKIDSIIIKRKQN